MAISFKVFTLWNKDSKPEVRKFLLNELNAVRFSSLDMKLQEIYPGLKNKSYTISWKDKEGDDIIISSDEELYIAYSTLGVRPNSSIDSNVDRKLYINVEDPQVGKQNDQSYAAPEHSAPGHEHEGVVCDSCDSNVFGFRYKCAVCHDFDLCSKCESEGKHPEHCMIRMPTPSLPHAMIKSAIKRSRGFLKTVNTNIPNECPYKKNKHERRFERKHSGDRHHHRHNRGSWLDTFATYMNEFANLAGDIGAAATADVKTESPASQEQATNTPAPEPSTSQKPETRPQMPVINTENLGKIFEMFLAQKMYDQNPQASSSAGANNDVEMGQGDRKSPEADKVSISSEASSSASGKKDEDKNDDWTMINKDKDVINPYVNPSAPAVEQSPPQLGFNLPMEFQERVKITGEGQSLYPPLNVATAVLNKLPEVTPNNPVPPQQASTANQPQAQPNQPKPAPKPHHPQAHIDAAIDHMLAMGFTNEGGWLTHLLESKDGNIAAVLDLLTPTSPKK